MGPNPCSCGFLNVDEAASLRYSLDQLRQSHYETDASFNRRFRDLAQTAYPIETRNADQQRSLVRAYARGLRYVDTAVKMVEQDNPTSIEDAMAWIARFSERKDAVSRLGLERTGEEPMEIGTLPTQISTQQPRYPSDSVLQQVLNGQERLMTNWRNWN